MNVDQENDLLTLLQTQGVREQISPQSHMPSSFVFNSLDRKPKLTNTEKDDKSITWNTLKRTSAFPKLHL